MATVGNVIDPSVEVFWSTARKNRRFYIVLWVLACLFVLVVLFRETIRDLSFLPFAALFLLALVYNTFFFRGVLQTRVEVSPGGLHYHSVGYDLSATWSQVSRVQSSRILGIWPYSALLIRSPAIRAKVWFDPPPRLPFLDRRDRVPIGARVWERNEQLIASIRRYAPQIDAAA